MSILILVGLLCVLFSEYSTIFIVSYVFYLLFEKKIKKFIDEIKNNSMKVKIHKLNKNENKVVYGYLSNYFKKYSKFKLCNDLTLCAKNTDFEDLSDLMLYYKENGVTSLKDFSRAHPAEYNSIIQYLLSYTTNKVSINFDVQVDANYKDAQYYIDEINEFNVNIENSEIKTKLFETVSLIKHIEYLAADFSDSKSKLRKLYQHYLPMLLEILGNYKSIRDSKYELRELNKIEDKVIKTIILVNEAINVLSVNFYESDAMNLSADILTLQAILRKDGLIEEKTINTVNSGVDIDE